MPCGALRRVVRQHGDVAVDLLLLGQRDHRRTTTVGGGGLDHVRRHLGDLADIAQMPHKLELTNTCRHAAFGAGPATDGVHAAPAVDDVGVVGAARDTTHGRRHRGFVGKRTRDHTTVLPSPFATNCELRRVHENRGLLSCAGVLEALAFQSAVLMQWHRMNGVIH